MSVRDKNSKKRSNRNPQPDFVPTELEEKYGPYRPIQEDASNKFQNNDKRNRNNNSRKRP